MSEGFVNEGAQAGEGAPRPVLLRAAREAAGLHIAALAAALKVPVRKLEALEAGRYDELPDLTFARALASSACRHLKIDPAPILAQLPQGVIPELGGSRQAINAPFQSAHDPAPIQPLGWLSRPALLAAIVLLLGALVIVFMPRVEERTQTEAGTVITPAETTVEPVAAVEPEPAQEPSPAETSSTPAAVGTAPAAPLAPAAPVAPAAAATADTPPATQTPSAPASGALLAIVAAGESWVEVTNGSGTVVMQRVLQAGDAVDFSTAPPYTVVLGRAEVAQVTVRGKPFDVSRFVRNNVARFEVK